MNARSLAVLAILLMAATTASAAQDRGASCAIKGNINEKGERIYHVPGDHWYATTKLDPSRGERWFCSEKEAQAAGWRAPGASCAIKGNIGEKGQRIYHVPGDSLYEKTAIDQTKGERWFCSEKDARAAGWRPSKR